VHTGIVALCPDVIPQRHAVDRLLGDGQEAGRGSLELRITPRTAELIRLPAIKGAR